MQKAHESNDSKKPHLCMHMMLLIRIYGVVLVVSLSMSKQI